MVHNRAVTLPWQLHVFHRIVLFPMTCRDPGPRHSETSPDQSSQNVWHISSYRPLNYLQIECLSEVYVVILHRKYCSRLFEVTYTMHKHVTIGNGRPTGRHMIQWKTKMGNGMWYVSYSALTLSDLENSLQPAKNFTGPISGTIQHVAYETNYNDHLSYCFYCRVRAEVLFNVICE